MRRGGTLWCTLGIAAGLCIAPALARAGTIAITFDDLPVFPEFTSLAKAKTVTDGLLNGFKRNGWPVTGFVNESQITEAHQRERTAVLKRWVDAGMDLGNHTYSHASLTTTAAAVYIRDISRGDAITKRLLRAKRLTERWFRYPYLESGATLEDRRRVEHWLSAHGYRVAPVSMQTSDWVFAEAYDDAVRHHEAAEAGRIRRSYLVYSDAIVAWYRRAAVDVIGHEPAFILLLHASALNAASVDALASILRKADLQAITLDEAIKDPAYARPEEYVGASGLPWVQRWALAIGKKLDSSTVPVIPADIQARYDKVEAEDPDSRAALPPSR